MTHFKIRNLRKWQEQKQLLQLLQSFIGKRCGENVYFYKRTRTTKTNKKNPVIKMSFAASLRSACSAKRNELEKKIAAGLQK